jgi:hypothetical protein
MKVITLQSVMVRGKFVPKNTKIDLEKNELTYFLNRNLVAPVKEDTTLNVPHTLEAETQPALIKNKKFGPLKSKKVE